VSVTVSFKDLGLPQTLLVRDLWLRKDLGTVDQKLSLTIPRHGSALLRVKAITTIPGVKRETRSKD
jgi:alpha-galactosidase